MEETKYRKIERLSPSSIIKLLTDYKGWYRNYVLGEKEPDNVYFQFGTAFHGFLEDFFAVEPTSSDNIKSFVERRYTELFDKWFTKNTELHTFFDEELGITLETSEEWTYNYLKQWVDETLPLEKKHGVVKAFNFNKPSICEWHLEDAELKVHGYADAYYGKDKYNVASGFINFHTIEDVNMVEFGDYIKDYKTSKVDRNTNNTKYYLQTLIYALMFTRANKRNKINFVCIDYLKYNQKYFYHVPEHILCSLEKLIKDIHRIIDKINETPEKYFDSPPEKLSLKDYL